MSYCFNIWLLLLLLLDYLNYYCFTNLTRKKICSFLFLIWIILSTSLGCLQTSARWAGGHETAGNGEGAPLKQDQHLRERDLSSRLSEPKKRAKPHMIDHRAPSGLVSKSSSPSCPTTALQPRWPPCCSLSTCAKRVPTSGAEHCCSLDLKCCSPVICTRAPSHPLSTYWHGSLLPLLTLP